MIDKNWDNSFATIVASWEKSVIDDAAAAAAADDDDDDDADDDDYEDKQC